MTHSFIAKQQSAFHLEVKSSLQYGVFQVIADFSEYYSFVLQDQAQRFHWNNSQVTIHPFVVYYTESGKLQQLSYVIIVVYEIYSHRVQLYNYSTDTAYA